MKIETVKSPVPGYWTLMVDGQPLDPSMEYKREEEARRAGVEKYAQYVFTTLDLGHHTHREAVRAYVGEADLGQLAQYIEEGWDGPEINDNTTVGDLRAWVTKHIMDGGDLRLPWDFNSEHHPDLDAARHEYVAGWTLLDFTDCPRHCRHWAEQFKDPWHKTLMENFVSTITG